MGFTRTIGRIGPLAVALGVGLAVGTTPGIAYAGPSDSASSSAGSSSTTGSPGDADASSGGSDHAGSGTESSGSGVNDVPSQDDDGSTEEDADTGEDADVAEDADVEADVDLDSDGEVDDADDESLAAGEEDTEPEASEEVAPEEHALPEQAPEAAPAAAEVSVADSKGGESADGQAAIVDEADAVDEADQAGAVAADASTDDDGQSSTRVVAAVAETSAPDSSVGRAEALTTVPAAAVGSPATPAISVPILDELADGVVRLAAQFVVDVLDLVLTTAGVSYDDTELPWLLALLAGLRRDIDEAYLAQYRDSLQANAALALSQSPNLLVNPGAELGDPSLSGNSAVSIPGWSITGTPTVIQYGALRNSWPVGLPFAMPDLPSFMGYPKAQHGPPAGGEQMFGGGNVADSQLTQIVDLSAAGAEIDTGLVTYNLSGWMGGWLANLSSASVKVDFLDTNKTYLGTTSIGPVGCVERLCLTVLKERETSGSVPEGTRYAQVDVIFDQVNLFPLGLNINYNSGFADNISFTVSADLPAPPPPTPPVSTVGELDHVFMVYMENKGYRDIIGSPNAPFTNSLVNAYGSANNFFALTHPSLPNYYPIIGGTDYGLTYECEAVCIFDHGPILTTHIDDAGMTWRGYAQSQPPGQPLENSGDYSVAQLPFVAFSGIGNNEAYAVQHLFPLDQMAIDLSSAETTPDFVWFAANESFNGEGPIDSLGDIVKFMVSQFSATHQYNVPALDQFLSETVPVIMNSNVWNDPAERSVLVVTFDEDNDNLSLGFGDEGNRIVTVVIPSPAAVAGGMRSGHFTATDKYDHYSLLRMIEDSLGLPTLTNNDKWAVPMNEFWT